jgi:hypothetical protein
MRYVKKTVVSLVLLGPMVSIAAPQSFPTKREAALLLQKAGEAADLRASDTPPFHLVATVHYTIGPQAFDGKYELLWASPDQFRETFKMGPAEEKEIALGDKLYILRTTQALSLPLWSVRDALRSIKRYFAEAGKNVSKVRASQSSKNNQYCVDSFDDFSRTQTCFDLATNETVYLDFGLFPSERAVYSAEVKQMYRLELNDFAALGERRFPLHISRQRLDEKLDIRVETFAKVKTFVAGLFEPPAGTEAHDWCSSPVPAGSLQIDRGSLFKVDPPGSVFAYYVLVGRDGRAEKSVPIREGGSFVDVRMAERLRMARFPILSCGGNPIKYETVVEAPIRVRFRH